MLEGKTGAGRELGREGLEALQESKHVHIATPRSRRRSDGIPMGQEDDIDEHARTDSPRRIQG